MKKIYAIIIVIILFAANVFAQQPVIGYLLWRNKRIKPLMF